MTLNVLDFQTQMQKSFSTNQQCPRLPQRQALTKQTELMMTHNPFFHAAFEEMLKLAKHLFLGGLN